MTEQQPKNPLHGITLEQIVNRLVEHYGWSELGSRIRIRCFNSFRDTQNNPFVPYLLVFKTRGE